MQKCAILNPEKETLYLSQVREQWLVQKNILNLSTKIWS
ncbi:uncharacterized protein METZ01_LOCUS32967 [marine metagenome]|uniref:Uncharacterized protein n=1 Tax=marine metagenome TaxID=408172 RepID=A0A381QRD9_9ZZZZ